MPRPTIDRRSLGYGWQVFDIQSGNQKIYAWLSSWELIEIRLAILDSQYHRLVCLICWTIIKFGNYEGAKTDTPSWIEKRMGIKGKRVLVTGAGGFIGSHLCEELLVQGADVTALVHYNSRGSWGNLDYISPEFKESIHVLAGDIEDYSYMAGIIEGKEVVFHLAALIGIPFSYVAPHSYVRTNIEGTLNVLEAARKLQVSKVVHTSTSETYGTALYTPIDESHPLQAQSPYAASKIGADKLAESYHRTFDLPVATIRPFNTYGPRQSARAVVPTIITQALSGLDVRLGSVVPVRDLTYVKNLTQAFITVAKNDDAVGRVTNAGTGQAISIGELAATILNLIGSDRRVILDETRLRPPASEVMKLVCDNRVITEEFGWTPKTSLKEGLQETIEFISQHMDHYKPEEYMI